jgi:hypothetical protein
MPSPHPFPHFQRLGFTILHLFGYPRVAVQHPVAFPNPFLPRRLKGRLKRPVQTSWRYPVQDIPDLAGSGCLFHPKRRFQVVPFPPALQRLLKIKR